MADAARLLAVIAGPDLSEPYVLERAWHPGGLVALRDDALDKVRLGLTMQPGPQCGLS